MSICHFASLCISGIWFSIWECEISLELAQLGHSGFGQKPNQNPIDQFWAYSDILGIKKQLLKFVNSIVASDKSFWPNQNKTVKSLKLANLAIFRPALTCWVSKGMYFSWESHWYFHMSHLNQTKTKPANPKKFQISQLSNFGPIGKCWVLKIMYSSWGID